MLQFNLSTHTQIIPLPTTLKWERGEEKKKDHLTPIRVWLKMAKIIEKEKKKKKKTLLTTAITRIITSATILSANFESEIQLKTQKKG